MSSILVGCDGDNKDYVDDNGDADDNYDGDDVSDLAAATASGSCFRVECIK